MYIENKYWNHYIGDTDDSLTLVEYLAGKQKERISIGEIFSDFGLEKLSGDFRCPTEPLVFVDGEEWEIEIHYAIQMVLDLAAMLLECKVSGTVNLHELFGDELETTMPNICIMATAEEHELINRVIKDFVSAPLSYDLSEMCSEEDMVTMAAICDELRSELYG